MLNSIISFSIKNKIIIGMLTVALVIWGSYSLTQLHFKHRLPPRGRCEGFDCPIVAEITDLVVV